MRFGIIIQARSGSKRLPKKILKKFAGKRTMLDFQLLRLLNEFNNKNIIIATTKLKEDNKICSIAKRNKIQFFRGSEKNLLKRHLDCANKFDIKNIVRVTSDCPLVDPILIKKMLKLFYKKKIDYFANTLPVSKATFPDGTDIEIFKTKSLLKLHKHAKNKTDTEHVTNLFWGNKKLFKSDIMVNKKDLSKYRFCVDYEDDFILANKLAKKIEINKLHGNANELVAFLKSDKSLMKINNKNKIKFKIYRKDLY
tara:strand:- start:390 stop:1148 length:759 start_codon:yes stop_codon:yes gene_type:complete